LPTEYCCPVRAPDWPRRGRLRRFAPATMQASCCTSVSEWLYLLEAALKRARQRLGRNVRGSLGLTQRRRNCWLPCNTNHTQSPHRPLLRAVSRQAPKDERNGQPRQPGRRGTPRCRSAFLLWESFGVEAFTIRGLTLVSALLFTRYSAQAYVVSDLDTAAARRPQRRPGCPPLRGYLVALLGCAKAGGTRRFALDGGGSGL
jgi:hypothetical protein